MCVCVRDIYMCMYSFHNFLVVLLLLLVLGLLAPVATIYNDFMMRSHSISLRIKRIIFSQLLFVHCSCTFYLISFHFTEFYFNYYSFPFKFLPSAHQWTLFHCTGQWIVSEKNPNCLWVCHLQLGSTQKCEMNTKICHGVTNLNTGFNRKKNSAKAKRARETEYRHWNVIRLVWVVWSVIVLCFLVCVFFSVD